MRKTGEKGVSSVGTVHVVNEYKARLPQSDLKTCQNAGINLVSKILHARTEYPQALPYQQSCYVTNISTVVSKPPRTYVLDSIDTFLELRWSGYCRLAGRNDVARAQNLSSSQSAAQASSCRPWGVVAVWSNCDEASRPGFAGIVECVMVELLITVRTPARHHNVSFVWCLRTSATCRPIDGGPDEMKRRFSTIRIDIVILLELAHGDIPRSEIWRRRSWKLDGFFAQGQSMDVARQSFPAPTCLI